METEIKEVYMEIAIETTMVVAKIIFDCCSVHGTMYCTGIICIVLVDLEQTSWLRFSHTKDSVINDLANKDKKYDFYDIV